MACIHIDDKVDNAQVHCTDVRFPAVSRRVGELFVEKMDRGVVPEAGGWGILFCLKI